MTLGGEEVKGRGWKWEVAMDRTSKSSVSEEAEGTGIGMLAGGKVEDPIDRKGKNSL